MTETKEYDPHGRAKLDLTCVSSAARLFCLTCVFPANQEHSAGRIAC